MGLRKFFKNHKLTCVVISIVVVSLIFVYVSWNEYSQAKQLVKQCDKNDVKSLYDTCEYLLQTDYHNLILEIYPLLFEHKDFASYINNMAGQEDEVNQATDFLYIKYFLSSFFEQSKEDFTYNLEKYFEKLSLDKSEYGYNASSSFEIRRLQQWGVFLSISDVREINDFLNHLESFIESKSDSYEHKALGYNILSSSYGELGYFSESVMFNQKTAIAEYCYNSATEEAKK